MECARCQTRVGEAFLKETADNSTCYNNISILKLFRYHLETESNAVPIGIQLYQDLMEHANAHASYRFIMMDEMNQTPCMLVSRVKVDLDFELEHSVRPH